MSDPDRFGAGNETRTRDPNLGKVVLYQLSYSRLMSDKYKDIFFLCNFLLHFLKLFSLHAS